MLLVKFKLRLIHMFRIKILTISRKFTKLNQSRIQNEPKWEFLYGVNPIQVAIAAKRRNFHSLIISDSETINTGPRAIKIINEAKNQNIPIVFTTKDRMNRMVGNQPHQNLIMKCSEISHIQSRQGKQYAEGIYVYCDKITDPQNFGAILRSCLYFGIKNIFVPKKNVCPLNSTVSKTSSGASELIEVHTVKKDQEFISSWKSSEGIVISTSVSPQTTLPISVSQLKQIHKKKAKTLIIFGSQGYGVSAHLSRNANYSVMIDRPGNSEYPYNLVDSLNVNAAVCCILSHITQSTGNT